MEPTFRKFDPLKTPLPTHFASAERASPERLKRDTQKVVESPLFRAVQESMDGYLMILNRERQVLAVNQRLLLDLGQKEPDCLTGLRPGEVIDCIHAKEGPGGCGTSRACATCGAVLSILASQDEGKAVNGECLASVRRNSHVESAEFRVRATPVRVAEDEFTVLVFNDISADKRREALERVFFHDILNTLSGLVGWSQLLVDRFESLDVRDAAQKIGVLSNRLLREIKDQQLLLRAEQGDLTVTRNVYPVSEVFSVLESVFSAHESAGGKTLVFDRPPDGATVMTDVSLLIRVLTNMIKNALEASAEEERVRVWLEPRVEGPRFLVHNPAVMPEEIVLQVFKRSFSTKGGRGRGIGTYSMKLFGERYLKGKVDFESVPEEGTTFWISLPPQKKEA